MAAPVPVGMAPMSLRCFSIPSCGGIVPVKRRFRPRSDPHGGGDVPHRLTTIFSRTLTLEQTPQNLANFAIG